MSNVKYTKPKRLSSMFAVISDLTLNVSAQSYGGFTIANIDSLIVPYAEKEYKERYEKHIDNDFKLSKDLGIWPLSEDQEKMIKDKAHDLAMKEIKKELMDGCQELEYKFNTVASSRGDFSE